MNSQKSLTMYIHIFLYHFLLKISKFLLEDSVLRKELFLKRIRFYICIVILFYAYYSHLDYMLIEQYNQFEDLTYLQRHDRYKILNWFLAGFIVYSLYFFISLVIVQLYKFVQTAKTTLACLFVCYSFLEYELLWELEHDFFCNRTVMSNIFFYSLLLFGVLFTEFGINLEEEYDDARLRNSEIAQKRGTTIQVEDWYNEQDLKEKTSKEFRKMQWQMSQTTKTQELLTDVFGNPDDLGETPEQVATRYKLHKRKMYPEFYEEISDEDRSSDFIERQFNETAETIVQGYLWIEKDYNKKRNFYFNRVAPFLKKYDSIPSRIITFFFMFSLRLFFFRPKVVGLYSFYHPSYAFNPKWVKKSFADFIFYKRIYYLFIQACVNFFFKFSPFRILNNRKWTKFHLKYYVRLLQLKKRRSGNYKFFKAKQS